MVSLETARKINAAVELATYAALFHQRLGQFIINILPDRFNNDPYNVSDEELVELARAYVKSYVRET